MCALPPGGICHSAVGLSSLEENCCPLFIFLFVFGSVCNESQTKLNAYSQHSCICTGLMPANEPKTKRVFVSLWIRKIYNCEWSSVLREFGCKSKIWFESLRVDQVTGATLLSKMCLRIWFLLVTECACVTVGHRLMLMPQRAHIIRTKRHRSHRSGPISHLKL